MPVRPDAHRRHTISDDDTVLVPDYGDDNDRADYSEFYIDDDDDDDDQPVTVSDLLDAEARGHRLTDLADLHRRADLHVRISYGAVSQALTAHRYLDILLESLSPEERAEFDRRTT